MTETPPIGYETENGTKYYVRAKIKKMPGVRTKDLDEDDMGVAGTRHLMVIQLDRDVAATVPEGELEELIETTASRILNENFAIAVLDDFDITYKVVTAEKAEKLNGSDDCYVHSGTVGDEDFEDADITPLEIDEAPAPSL